MNKGSRPHITVCICTFKRPEMLRRLLAKLCVLQTDNLFSYSIVIVDNDASRSAKEIVDDARKRSAAELIYTVEPNQNIALARNKAVERAEGELIGFIDDDELPQSNWILRLLGALHAYKADGVLGPVKPSFESPPPRWKIRAGLFDRPNSLDYKSGLILKWDQTGTGNVLISRHVFDDLDGPFRAQFGSGGEDQDFFRRAMQRGHVFVWCAEAIVRETVPVERTRICFQLKRALLRGSASLATGSARPAGVVKSLSACSIYTMLLPIYLVIGRHMFIRQLIKTCDHLGKLLALCGVKVVREKYLLR
jgi:succinoglycan biosynthesis protein ExoM